MSTTLDPPQDLEAPPTAAQRRNERWRRAVARHFATLFGDDLVSRGPNPIGIITPSFGVACFSLREIDAIDALHDAVKAASSASVWPLAVGDDRGNRATATMFLDHFTDLLGEWWGARLERARRTTSTQDHDLAAAAQLVLDELIPVALCGLTQPGDVALVRFVEQRLQEVLRAK